MFVPVFINAPFVKSNGMLTDPMQIFMDQLNQSMLAALSDNGWTIPQIDSTDILLVEPAMPDGTVWIVTDISPQQLVIKLDGALRKITTTAYP